MRSAELAEETGLAPRPDHPVGQGVRRARPGGRLPGARAAHGLPLHLGLTEAGMGTRGIVASTAGLSILLHEGIGDTIRVSLTPSPGAAASTRSRSPSRSCSRSACAHSCRRCRACPGCGRTTSTFFQELAREVAGIPAGPDARVARDTRASRTCAWRSWAAWSTGRASRKHADIGISLPGTFEEPVAPVYVDGSSAGRSAATASSTSSRSILEGYVDRRYGSRRVDPGAADRGPSLTARASGPIGRVSPEACLRRRGPIGRQRAASILSRRQQAASRTWVTTHVFCVGGPRNHRTPKEAHGESRFRRRPPPAECREAGPARTTDPNRRRGIQSAYRRVGGDEDIHVRIEPKRGRIRVFRPARGRRGRGPADRVHGHEAPRRSTRAQLGDLVETEQLDGDAFGRIHAQTAKQVVLQRLREAERDVVFDQFASREGEMITGSVNRVEPRAIILDVGKNVEAILATTEQSPVEHYRIGQNVKAYVLEVRRTTRGPQIYVSRTHKGFLAACSSSRCRRSTPGPSRSRRSRGKPAAARRSPSPAARTGLTRSGQRSASAGRASRPSSPSWAARRSTSSRGTTTRRVFVANALSPAQVISVNIDEEHRIANVTVPERMLSLAIGREGQNARLAAKLTGWRIDIRSDVPSPRRRGPRRGRQRGRAPRRGARPRRGRDRPRPRPATAAPPPRPPRRRRGAEAEGAVRRRPRPAAAPSGGRRSRRPRGRRGTAGRPRRAAQPRRSRREAGRATSECGRRGGAAAAAERRPRAAEAAATRQAEGNTRTRKAARGGVVVGARRPAEPATRAAVPDAHLRRVPDVPPEARAGPGRPDAGRSGRLRRDGPARRPRRLSLPRTRLLAAARGRPRAGARRRCRRGLGALAAAAWTRDTTTPARHAEPPIDGNGNEGGAVGQE